MCIVGVKSGITITEVNGYSSRVLSYDYPASHPYGRYGSGLPWQAPGFDDSKWTQTTPSINDNPKTSSIYLRCTFNATAAQAANTNNLQLSASFGNGFVAFMNGKEWIRKSMGPSQTFTWASAISNNDRYQTTVSFAGDNAPTGANSLLVTGQNVIAVQVHNSLNLLTASLSRETSDTTRLQISVSISGGGTLLSTTATTCKKFTGLYEPSGYFVDPATPVDVLGSPFSIAFTWIELFNNDTTSLDLSGYSISDTTYVKQKYVFPSGTVVPANSYYIIFVDGENFKGNYVHTNFGLDNDGGFIGIYDKSSNLITSIDYPEQSPYQCWGVTSSSNSTTTYFDTCTPGADNIKSSTSALNNLYIDICSTPDASVPEGIITGTVNVVLTTKTPNATIRYTLSNSADDPTTTSTIYTSPIQITSSKVLKAKVYKNGYIPSKVATFTYILNPRVSNLPIVAISGSDSKVVYTPNGILAISGGYYDGNGVWGVNSNAYSDYNLVVMDNPAQERPIALSLIFPASAGVPNLNFDVGIRQSSSEWQAGRNKFTQDQVMNTDTLFDIYDSTRKSSFNIFWRDDYGKKRYIGKMIPYSPIQQHKRLRLRSGKNDIVNPYITDEWMRRSFADMGQASCVGYIASLYVNAYLKGFYNIAEKLEEDWLQASHGIPDSAAWDILKVNVWESGNNTWKENMRNYLISNNLNTAAVWNKVITEYWDMDNLVDYLLLNSFVGTWDWPQNNFYAARAEGNRMRFYVWDAEGAMNLYGDRPPNSYNTFTSDYVASTSSSADSLLIPVMHSIFKDATEYKLKWQDRVQQHMFNGGALTITAMTNRWNALKNEFLPLLTAYTTETFNDKLSGYMSTRWNTYFDQLRSFGFWQDTYKAPTFTPYGGVDPKSITLSMAGTGTIYYTTDGSDPRAIGGSIVGTKYASALTITKPSVVCARTYTSSNWSPLDCVTITILGGYPVVFTEIMYRSLGGKNFEFVEIKNTGSVTLDMTGISIYSTTSDTSGGTTVYTRELLFDFPDAFKIKAGAFAVIASDLDGFSDYYGFDPHGAYYVRLGANYGKLDIVHTATNTTINSITYYSNQGWPALGKGYGFSIVPTNPNPVGSDASYNSPSSWRISSKIGGSPNADDPSPPVFANIKVNEIYPHSPEWVELYNPTAAPVDVSNWFITDDVSDPWKGFQIPASSVIPANSTVAFTNTNWNIGFSSYGEDVYVFAANQLKDLLGYFDGFEFHSARTDISFAQYADCNSDYYVAIPTTATDGTQNTPPRDSKIASISAVNLKISSKITSQFVEITSMMSTQIDLTGWTLSREKRNGILYTFKSGNVIAPFGSIIVVSGTNANTIRTQITIPASTTVLTGLNTSIDITGGPIALTRPLTNTPYDQTIIDFVDFSQSLIIMPTALTTAVYRQDLTWAGTDYCNWNSSRPKKMSVTAQVVDGANNPIPSVAVCLNTMGVRQLCVSTAANGTAVFNNIITSRYSYNVTVDFAAITSVPFPLAESPITNGQTTAYSSEWKPSDTNPATTVTFKFISSPWIINGNITTDRSIDVSNITVTLSESGSSTPVLQTTTDGSGLFQFTETAGISLQNPVVSVSLNSGNLNANRWFASQGWTITGTEATYRIPSLIRGDPVDLVLSLSSSPTTSSSASTTTIMDLPLVVFLHCIHGLLLLQLLL